MDKRGFDSTPYIIPVILGILVLVAFVWAGSSLFATGVKSAHEVTPDARTIQANYCKTIYASLGEIDYCKYREIELVSGKKGYVNCDYELLKPLIGANPLEGTCDQTPKQFCENVLLQNIENKASVEVSILASNIPRVDTDGKALIVQEDFSCDLSKAGA